MTQPLRTFVGVPVPCTRELRAALATCREFGRPVRPVAEENIHVTLKFLGETPPGQIAAIAEVLQAAVLSIESFASELRGLSAFPHPRRPAVIWAGCNEPDLWMQLAKAVEHPLRKLGFPRENRQFHPHATLARVRGRPPAELTTWLDEQADTPFGGLDVQTVTLIQSDLSAAGARYLSLATATLARRDQT